jgi:hypothetical protein
MAGLRVDENGEIRSVSRINSVRLLLLSRHFVDIIAIGYPLELVRLANSFIDDKFTLLIILND